MMSRYLYRVPLETLIIFAILGTEILELKLLRI